MNKDPSIEIAGKATVNRKQALAGVLRTTKHHTLRRLLIATANVHLGDIHPQQAVNQALTG